MKTREKMLMKIREPTKKDPYKKYSFTKVNTPLIRFIVEDKPK